MIGIRGFGVHVPRYRLSAATLAAAWAASARWRTTTRTA